MKLLFTSGTARGGTNLRTYILNSHQRIALSIDAFLPLFKYWRSRIVHRSEWKDDNVEKAWNKPLPDIFNNPQGLDQYATFCTEIEDIRIPKNHWRFLSDEIVNRANLAGSLFAENIKSCNRTYFSESIYMFAEIIAEFYSNSECEIVGFQENWLTEFFLPLSIIFDQAKFISYIRDPRAVINSSENHEADKSKHPAVFSMARHVRKHIFLSLIYQKSSTFENKFCITKYETCINDRHLYVKDVTKFLDIEQDLRMLDYSVYRDGSNLPLRKSFNVYRNAVDNWKDEMSFPLREITLFINQKEMLSLEYISS
jgi:hypothetical protein